MIAAPEIVLVGPCVVRVSCPTSVAVPDRYPQARQRAPRDSGGDLALQREEIERVTLVLFGPDMPLGLRLNELRRDSNAIADSANARLEQIRDAELARDFVGSLRRVLVVHRRRAGDDPKSRGVGSTQMGDHLLGQPVAEVLLFGIAGQVLERQHGQHDPAAVRGRRRDEQRPRCIADGGDESRRSKRKRGPAPPRGSRPGPSPRLVDFCSQVAERVAVSGDGTDEARIQPVFSERFPNLTDEIRQILLDDKRIGPEPVLKLRLGQGFRSFGDENLEKLKRLRRQSNRFGPST